MAQLKITSKLEGLSPAEMAETAKRYPYEDKGEPIDGDPYASDRLPLDRRTVIAPDGRFWTVGSRLTAWSDPRTAPVVQSWQKRAAIEVRKGREGWKGDVRAKRDGTDGPEYDRLLFTLSKAEAAELGPEGVRAAFAAFIDAVRVSPYGGMRLVEVEPMHTDTDHLHIHVNAHRHGYDVADRIVSRTVWMPEIHTKEAQRIAETLPDALTLEYIAPGTAAARASDEARAATADLLRDAGAVPSADLTGEGRHAVKRALPSPEEARIAEAMQEIERRMALRQQEQQEDAALLARVQHAAAAMQEAAQLRESLAAEQAARAAAEQEVIEATERLQSLSARVAAMDAEAVQAAEQLTRAEDRADTAERLAAQRYAELEEIRARLQAAEQHAAEEPDRTAAAVAEAIQPVQAERDAAVARAEAAEAALAEERRTFPERVAAAVRDAVAAARQEWERTVAAPLRAELDTLKATVAQLATAFDAMKAAGFRDPAEERRQLDALARQGKPWAELSRRERALVARDFARELDAAAALGDDLRSFPYTDPASHWAVLVGAPQDAPQGPQPGGGSPAPAEPPKATQAAPRGRRAGADFLSVPPLEWTPAQRAAAAEALEKKRAADPEKWQGYTVDRYGEEGHAAWQRRQAPKPKM